MQFTDEDSRDKYHKTTTLTQLVCAMFESFCIQHRLEPELIDIVKTRIIIGVAGISEEAGYDICDKLNNQFKRNDMRPTCVLSDPQLGVFNLLITGSADFRELI